MVLAFLPRSRAVLPVIGFCLVWVVLFLNFGTNYFEVVSHESFQDFQRDSESLVLARLVESRENGIFSHNALLGWGDADPARLEERVYRHQYDVFLSRGSFQTYSLYKSVPGGQALFFGILSQMSRFAPATGLRVFHFLMAFLMAGAISLFIAWVAHEFGFMEALAVGITGVLSQWLTLFGPNLFYFIWATFLPLGLMAWYLALEPKNDPWPDAGPGMIAFGLVLFKCLMNGFDFIVPALFMPAIPVLYHAVRDRWSLEMSLRRAAALVLGLVAAIAVAVTVLAAQLQASEGSLAAGFGSILATLGRRTYFADPVRLPEYAQALQATHWTSVLWTYLTQSPAMQLINVSFLDLVAGFGAMTLVFGVLHRLYPGSLPMDGKTEGLIFSTWAAVLAPISWFLIFKGQAVVHTHTNYLAWHMPFTLFGFAMSAWLLRRMTGASVRQRSARDRNSPSHQ